MFDRRRVTLVMVAALLIGVATAPSAIALDRSGSGTSLRIADAASTLRTASRLNPPPANPTGPGVEVLVRDLNAVRQRNGAPQLRLDPDLSATARAWSEEMARSGFRHSNGQYAENVAWASSTRLTPDAAAQMFVELWTNSPGHFANMTNTRYREVGIGLYLDNGGWWATQLFR